MPMNDRRTPLGRVLGTGSAKDGTGHWWTQRLSAVALVFLGLWFLVSIAQLQGFGQAEVGNWLARPSSAVLMLLLIVSIAWHSDLGIRVIIEDYVHQAFLKIAAIVCSRFLHALLAALSVFAVLRMALA